MGQILRLPLPPAHYPRTTSALAPAESVFLLGLRWWVADFRQGTDPLPRLCQAMDTAGAHDAAFSVDRLMGVIARTARRQIDVHCPRCPHLSDDEKTLLYAASTVQAGDNALADRVLRTTLLSASGAEFALGPLEGLCELFAEVKLFFARRRSPAMPELPEAWSPGMPLGSLH